MTSGALLDRAHRQTSAVTFQPHGTRLPDLAGMHGWSLLQAHRIWLRALPIMLPLLVLLCGCSAAPPPVAAPTPAAGAAAAPTPGAPATQVVTDMYGASVTVPTRVDRIADGWPAHNSLLVMLGVANKLVATTPIVQAYPWFLRIDPAIATVSPAFGTSVNNEQLVQSKPDVVFLSQTDDNTVKSIRGLGLPLVQVYFTDFAQLEACFQLTGLVVGGDAPARATQYVSYLDDHLAAIRSRTSQIPAERRPSVVHLSSVQPLMVDGRDTIIDQWIDTAGGRNAAHDDIVSNGKTVTFEQVLAWDPDVLILGGTVAQVDSMRSDPQWHQLRAVSTGRVYVNPKGVFPWDRYGPEEALQIQWAARLLHPDLFSDLDLVRATRGFYQDFFA